MSQQPPQEPPEPYGPPQGQGGWQPPPPDVPRPPKPFYKKWWFILGAIVVGLIVLGSLVGSEEEQPTATTRAQAATPTTAGGNPETTDKPTPTVRETDLRKPVRDGSFEFVVSAFTCRGSQCAATMRVENIGKEPGTMFADNQYLFDTQGRRFAAESELTDALLFEELNPGGNVRGTIKWRVPAKFKPDHLELHDSIFSGGVEVKV